MQLNLEVLPIESIKSLLKAQLRNLLSRKTILCQMKHSSHSNMRFMMTRTLLQNHQADSQLEFH